MLFRRNMISTKLGNMECVKPTNSQPITFNSSQFCLFLFFSKFCSNWHFSLVILNVFTLDNIHAFYSDLSFIWCVLCLLSLIFSLTWSKCRLRHGRWHISLDRAWGKHHADYYSSSTNVLFTANASWQVEPYLLVSIKIAFTSNCCCIFLHCQNHAQLQSYWIWTHNQNIPIRNPKYPMWTKTIQ